MPDNIRDLPAGSQSDGLYRFLGGSPLSVAFRLILLVSPRPASRNR